MIDRRGLTLADTLATLGILAVLAAIVFPVFVRAGEAGRRTACLSRQKQLLLALRAYTLDFDDTWPVMYWDRTRRPPGWTSTFPGYWGGALAPYLPARAPDPLFLCPESGDRVCSYIYNAWLSARNEATIPGLASVAALADARGDGWWAIDRPAQTLPGKGCRLSDRHLRGANFAFCDGSVRWLRRSEWRPGFWNPLWEP